MFIICCFWETQLLSSSAFLAGFNFINVTYSAFSPNTGWFLPNPTLKEP